MLKLNASLTNLKNKPFFLKDKEIEWVEETLQSMSLHERWDNYFVQLAVQTINKI